MPSSDSEGLLPARCWLLLAEAPGKGTLIRLRPGSLSRRRGLHCVSGCAYTPQPEVTQQLQHNIMQACFPGYKTCTQYL